MDYKYAGIVIGKKDIGETDRLYTIYTLESGKIKVLAKGARKGSAKLAANLESFTLSDIGIVRNQGIGKVTASIVENNFSALKNNFKALTQAFAGTKMLNRMTAWDEKDERIFWLLKDYLETLDRQSQKEDDDLEIIALGFGFKLFSVLGYGLEVGGCVVCGQKLQTGERNFFSAAKGGIVCSACQKNSQQLIQVSPNVIKAIRIFFQSRIGSLTKLKIAPKDLRELQIVLNSFLVWTER